MLTLIFAQLRGRAAQLAGTMRKSRPRRLRFFLKIHTQHAAHKTDLAVAGLSGRNRTGSRPPQKIGKPGCSRLAPPASERKHFPRTTGLVFNRYCKLLQLRHVKYHGPSPGAWIIITGFQICIESSKVNLGSLNLIWRTLKPRSFHALASCESASKAFLAGESAGAARKYCAGQLIG